MRRSRQSPATDPGRRSRPDRGAVRLEVSLALLVLVLAVWLGADLLGRFRDHRRCDRYIADLQTFSAVFRSYGRATGFRAPAHLAPGTLPPALAARLKDTSWAKGSPFGGRYEWRPPGAASGGFGAIVVTAFAPDPPLRLSRADLRRIDTRIDDGNLATGRFRAGFDGWPVYLLQKQ